MLSKLQSLIIFCLLSLFSKGFADEWKCVYLATFPRSGNHWVRYLIEEATHIATSSMYCEIDPPHLKTLFPWGGYVVDHGYEGTSRYPEPGETAIIKTHFPCYSQWHKIGPLHGTKSIRIIRHPIDSFYSLHIYNARGKPATSRIPKRMLQHFIDMWQTFQDFWDAQPDVFTVRYEDLYERPHETLKQILQEAGYFLCDEDITRAVAKHPPRGGLLKHLERFSPEDLELISSELNEPMRQYGYSIPDLENFNSR